MIVKIKLITDKMLNVMQIILNLFLLLKLFDKNFSSFVIIICFSSLRQLYHKNL